jgi:hypothetical protein
MRSLLQQRACCLTCAEPQAVRELVVRLRRGGYRVMPPAGVMLRGADAGRRDVSARLNHLSWSD